MLELVTRFIPDMVQAMNGVRSEAMHEQLIHLNSTCGVVAGELRRFSAATEACNQLEDISHRLHELSAALRLVEERHGVVTELISESASDSQPLSLKGATESEKLVAAIQSALWHHYSTLRQIRKLRPLLRDSFTLSDDETRAKCRARALKLQEELEVAASGWGVVFGELAMETVLLIVLATGALVEPGRMDHHRVSQAQIMRFALSGLVIFMSQLSPVVRNLADSRLVAMLRASGSKSGEEEQRQADDESIASAADAAQSVAHCPDQPAGASDHHPFVADLRQRHHSTAEAPVPLHPRAELATPEEPMMLG